MKKLRPKTQTTTPLSSNQNLQVTKKLAQESKSQNVSDKNLSLLSEQALSRTSVTFGTAKKITQPKSYQNPHLHALSTRSGSLVFKIENKKQKKTRQNLMSSNNVSLSQIEEIPTKSYVLLSEIAEKLSPQYIGLFLEKPIFLRTILVEGTLNQTHINKILPHIMFDNFFDFMKHMTEEVSIHSSLSACTTTDSAENILPKIVHFKKVLFWLKPFGADFLISTTLKEIVPMGRSIVGFCAHKQKKVITEDPAMASGFDIDYDLPNLRGTESMALYPIISDFGDLVAVVQFIDFYNNFGTVVPISKYYSKLLKLACEIIKNKLFVEETQAQYVSNDLIPLLLMSGSVTFEKFIMRILTFLKKYFDCEGADIFEYDSKKRRLKRLLDGQIFSESKAGLSYLSIVQDEPIFIAHGLQMGFSRSSLDRKYTNNSALTANYIINESQFVFTLRSKWLLPAFLPVDLKKLNDISTILCVGIQNAQLNKSQKLELEGLQRSNYITSVLGNSLSSYIDQKDNKWHILRNAAKNIFGAETCFVCSFDGINMLFHPTDVKWKFDDCIAGKAFNYQELQEFKQKENEENFELYQKLGVTVSRSIAFHYFSEGKVKASIELINPKIAEIDANGQSILGIICSVIEPF